MAILESQFTTAVVDREIPGVVLAASNATGDFHYQNAFGYRSLQVGKPTQSLKVTDTFFMASCTKLITAIAVMQCVENGQFTLDEDVTRLLPELKNIEILKGFDKETKKPILVRATKKLTLRLFLSHSSGLAYESFSPILQKWRRSLGEETHLASSSLIHRYTAPLLFEPGEGFAYGTGCGWAGIMIERSNNMTLGDYMKKNIWDPLGITGMTFHPEHYPEILATMVDMSVRLGGANKFGTPAKPTEKVVWSKVQLRAHHMEDHSGGAGLSGRATDYVKILRSITAGDGRLLKSSSIDELFKPQLSASSKAAMDGLMKIPELNDSMGISMPKGTKLDYGLGGMLCLEDIPGRRRSGTMFWSGLPNLMWWSDRKAGMCGIYASQLIPTGDPRSLSLFADFERVMYEGAKSATVKAKSQL